MPRIKLEVQLQMVMALVHLSMRRRPSAVASLLVSPSSSLARFPAVTLSWYAWPSAARLGGMTATAPSLPVTLRLPIISSIARSFHPLLTPCPSHENTFSLSGFSIVPTFTFCSPAVDTPSVLHCLPIYRPGSTMKRRDINRPTPGRWRSSRMARFWTFRLPKSLEVQQRALQMRALMPRRQRTKIAVPMMIPVMTMTTMLLTPRKKTMMSRLTR
mmetsp:Transcript_18148/g.51940  ORF Transcript_18148/g.51940 Transcript_18148/m.51940 type:complete len:215 (-) Transcript_18148:346-990(-)